MLILNPLKNTQHSLATPQFSKTLSETALHKNTKIQYSKKKGIEYTWVLQSLRFRSTKPNLIPHT